MAVKQTAGRKELGEFAPKFAELNDDVLFGEVWSREDKLSLRDRSLVTVTSLPQCQVMNQKKLSKKSFFDSSVFNIYSHFLPCVLRADEI